MNLHRIFLPWVAAACIAVSACGTDDITITDINPIDNELDTGDDNLDSVVFDRTVTVVYSGGIATVEGTGDSIDCTVSGAGVTLVNAGSEVVRYELSGSTTDGFFKLYSGKKQAVVLNGLSLTSGTGAAINIQGRYNGAGNKPSGGKRTWVVVQGSNSLTDGVGYSATPECEDEKGALFCEGKLVVCGSGSLAVTARGKNGIASDDYVHFQNGPTVKVNSAAGHGVRGKDAILVSGGTIEVEVSANMKKGFSSDSLVHFAGGVTSVKVTGSAAYDSEDEEYTGTAGVKADVAFVMSGGSLTVENSGTGGKGISCDGTGTFSGGTVDVTVTGSNYSAGDISAKGIKCDGDISFSGGTVNVSCRSHEGIESKGEITVSGGEVYSYSQADDAINSGSHFTVSGGMVCGHATSNDGLDANGNFYIKGGVVYAIGSSQPEVAIDANTEKNYKLYVQEGATLIAIGGLERGSSLEQSCYQASSWSKNTWYALSTGGNTYAFKTPSSGGTALVVSGPSTPTLTSGVSVTGGTSHFAGTLTVGGTVSGGNAVSLSAYSGGSGPGGGGGGPH